MVIGLKIFTSGDYKSTNLYSERNAFVKQNPARDQHVDYKNRAIIKC